MRLHRPAALLVCLACLLVTAMEKPTRAAPPSRRSAIVQAVERNKPAVVNIQSERSQARLGGLVDPFAAAPSQSRSNGMGTGIIIDPRGYIVTNHHVVEEVLLIKVRLHDGGVFSARVVARDKDNDLAILKIDAGRPLPTIVIGTSSDLMIGETVVAIGNAFGYEHTVTVGVISALNRDVTLNREVSYRALIQTDASINPGNSGGPLLNVDGELVGVNVAIRAGAQGISFAIPVDQMVRATTEMLAGRRRQDLTPGLVCKNCIDLTRPSPRSLQVDRVDPAGAAAKAGLKPGDVIVRAGDLPVASSLDLERALIDARPGDPLPLRVKRGDLEQEVALVLQADAPAVSPDERVWKQLGLRLGSTSPDLISRQFSTLRGGMLVTEVLTDGPAAKAGFQKGDILLGLHQWETISPENVTYVLTHPDLASFSPIRFYLLRGGQVHRGYLQPE